MEYIRDGAVGWPPDTPSGFGRRGELFAFHPTRFEPARNTKGEKMEDFSHVAGRLDRAGNVFGLAARVGAVIFEIHRNSGDRISQDTWDEHLPEFDLLRKSLAELSDITQDPPNGLETVGECLQDLNELAERIQSIQSSTDGINTSSYLQFLPRLNTAAQFGSIAVKSARNAILKETSDVRPFTLLDRFPATPRGHIGFLELLRHEVSQAAFEKGQQGRTGQENAMIESMINGIAWTEARERLTAIWNLTDATEQVGRVLAWELSFGTIEQIDTLLEPAVNALRAGWENDRQSFNFSKGATANRSLVELIDSVVRRLTAMPDFIRNRIWNHPDTLDVSRINVTAAEIGLGPVFEIGQAPDWVTAPNLPDDHPVNQLKIECLTVYHPDGSEYRICRTSGQLDDSSGLPILETIARLNAWAEIAEDLTQTKTMEKNSAEDLRETKPKRRGRKMADESTVKREAELAEDWKRAHVTGVCKVDFVGGIKSNVPIGKKMTVKDFDKLLDRVSSRNRHSE